MIPVAITTLAPLANTALETWNRMSEARENAQVQNAKSAAQQDFRVLLAKASAVGGATAAANPQFQANLQQQFQKQISELPEVRGLLAASQPGTQLQLSLSSQDGLSLALPGGAKQPIILSDSSKALIQQISEVASVSHPGNVSGLVRFSLTA